MAKALFTVHPKTIVSCRVGELPMENRTKKTDFYEVLSLASRNVGFDEIKRAYRKMALVYHPDVCPSLAKEESTKRFLELREAYEILTDPLSRKQYDYELSLCNGGNGSACSSMWLGLGFEGENLKKNNRFPREVWEMQLHNLKQYRMEKRNKINKKYYGKEVKDNCL